MSILADNMRAGRYTPKYVELARELLRDIAARKLGQGDRLATESELIQRYRLSRVTVRQALELLEKEGYVLRRRARGTFVQRAVDSVEQFGLIRGTVLLVCSNEQDAHRHEDTAFVTVLCAMEQALARQGFTVQLATIGRNPSEDRARLRTIAHRGDLEGVLAIGPDLEPYRDLFRRVPVVTSCTFLPCAPRWVGDDVSMACRESIEHLIEHGHRRIAMVCSAQIGGEAFAHFARGYQQAFEAAGLPWDRALLFQAYPGEELDDLAEQVLSSRIRPTAVFGENWRVCRAIVKTAQRRGLAIPRDLSIVGYGQNVLEINDPAPLTAYVPQTARIGQAAAELLVGLIHGEASGAAEPITIPGHLEQRGSVQPPRPAEGDEPLSPPQVDSGGVKGL